MKKFKTLNTKIKTFLDTLDDKIVSKSEKLSWFNELIAYFVETFSCVNHSQFKDDKKLFLHVPQILTSFYFLKTIFVKEFELEVILTEARKFATKQIISCVENFEPSLTGNNLVSEDNLGCFIKHIDFALEKVANVNSSIPQEQESQKEKCEVAKCAILEALTHAMVIAQISLEEDCKIIRGSSLSVFESIDYLVNELNKETPNSAMVNLFIEICSDKMCALERRVNNAVLKLSLKVFSEYRESIEKIHKYCFENSYIENNSKMEDLVAEFDLNVDRILQIGLFAVSCTEDVTNGIKIKSCLMSIEALERELIPAFSATLLSRSVNNSQLALLLKGFWLMQMEVLQKLVFRIIDPYAFCQTVFEENKIVLEKFSLHIKESGPEENESVNNLLTILMKHTKVLQKFVKVIIEEQQEDNVEQIKKAYKEFNEVFHEVKRAPAVLHQEFPDHNENNRRILKRCKILLKTTKTLVSCFVDDSPSDGQENFSQDSSQLNETVRKPSSIDDIGQNAFFSHIINRGKDILKDRSNLCVSFERDLSLPKVHETTREQLKIMKSTPLSKLVHLRKLNFSRSISKNDTHGILQYTDIVNELNNLSKTFSVLSGEG